MMISRRDASDRGHANHGWLESRHTFSFANYYDAEQMGFSALRVINDDRVQPAAGFDPHSHRNMEIISYVLSGVIEHEDSEGNVQRLPAGEYQLMSAGSGITHSEYNASKTQELRFLQIWIEPNTSETAPGYQQKAFGKSVGLTPIATPTGESGTLKIKQDARLSQLILAPSSDMQLEIPPGRRLYIHLVSGQLQIDDTKLSPGDGAKVESQAGVTLANQHHEQTMALVFDLP